MSCSTTRSSSSNQCGSDSSSGSSNGNDEGEGNDDTEEEEEEEEGSESVLDTESASMDTKPDQPNECTFTEELEVALLARTVAPNAVTEPHATHIVEGPTTTRRSPRERQTTMWLRDLLDFGVDEDEDVIVVDGRVVEEHQEVVLARIFCSLVYRATLLVDVVASRKSPRLNCDGEENIMWACL